MSIEIIDFFVDEDTSNYINSMLTSNIFPWVFCENIVSSDDSKRSQFIHMFYNDGEPRSPFYKHLLDTQVMQKLSMSAIIKIKANIQIATENIETNTLHIDHSFPNALTAIYYVNDNNGYTFFDTGEVIESKKGRIVIFPSNYKHSGTTCTDKKYRSVINFNYYPQSL